MQTYTLQTANKAMSETTVFCKYGGLKTTLTANETRLFANKGVSKPH
jgi:hypothetical protein